MFQKRCSFILIVFLCIPFCEIHSQHEDTTVIKHGAYPRTTAEYFTSGGSGNDCSWDFSNLKISKNSHLVSQDVDSIGQIVVTDDRQIAYYIIRNDSLLEVGNESPMKEISYYKPICRMRYPIVWGDSISKPFEGYGIYCGDHIYKESGVSTTIVDGAGKIILSETDTLRNVLRVYKLRSYSVAMDMDPSKLDSTEIKQIIEERYEWYLEGCSRPAFETITSTSYADQNQLGTTRYAYCNIPTLYSEQNNQNDTISQSHEEDTLHVRDIIHYNISSDGYHVNIEYNLKEKATITMLISNNMGVIYDSKRYSHDAFNDYHASFDIGGLRPGVYVLYINVNGKVYSEKIKK